MREIEGLQQAWQQSAQLRGLFANLSLEKDGLVLGATRVLVRRDDTGALEIEGNEARVLALLAVAYGRTVDASILGAISRASKHANAGNLPMAAMHIALAGLPRLADPADAARRIFIADGLLGKGILPRDIFAALEFDPAPLDQLEKYDPNEPRNPKGSGRTSGEWTRDIEAVESAVETFAERLPRIASRIVDVGAVLEPFVFPLRAGGDQIEGPVPGHPELRYSLIEGDLEIVRASDGHAVLRATLGPGGKFYSESKRVVGRVKGDKVEIGPSALPPDWPGPDDNDEPRLCPKESPDRPGMPRIKGEKARDFEDYMKRRVNPDNPTPRGFGYAFIKPWDPRNAIIVDDCQHRTGDLYDAKGTSYLRLLTREGDFMRDNVMAKLVAEAKNQIAVSQGRKIHWVFAEEQAADVVRRQFEDSQDLARIDIEAMPWREGMK